MQEQLKPVPQFLKNHPIHTALYIEYFSAAKVGGIWDETGGNEEHVCASSHSISCGNAELRNKD